MRADEGNVVEERDLSRVGVVVEGAWERCGRSQKRSRRRDRDSHEEKLGKQTGRRT